MSLLVEYVRQFGRFQRNARLYLISNALSGMTIGIIQVLYNLYLVSLGYKTDFVGLLLFMTTVGAGVAIFPAGLCIDRFGGKAILIWASVVIGVAGAGQFLFRQPLFLLLSGLIAGVAGAFILVVNAPFLTRNSSQEERSLLFSFNIVVTLATTVLGELLGGALPVWLRANAWLMGPLPGWLGVALVSQPEARAYQLSLLFAGIIAIPSFLPLFLLREESQARSATTSLVREQVPWRVRMEVVFQRWSEIDARALIVNPITVLVVVQMLVGFGAGLFIPYFNLYFVHYLGASPALFGSIDGGANALNAVLTLVAPLFVLRIGRVNTIVATRAGSIPILLVIGLVTFLPLLAPLYLLRQGLMDMGNGVFQAFSMETVSRKHRGVANSTYQAAFYIANGLATPLGGLLITRSGYAIVFLSAVVLYTCSVALLWGRFGRGVGERLVASVREHDVTEGEPHQHRPQAIVAES
ncbi:MFS transporter [Ktedonospora formicarum]|uniref:MFS transporter n=1 Tax=Ktedonospora formicarum TaxID=2778364 RepID=A0A8J3MSK5_9CHLR|nr:MFS transporter [Ktedonospora formicarum]GHO43430.1 MFS transporter [Ktedonospora formicarum]